MTATIYTTDWCPWCDLAKSYLEQASIAYREINIEAEFEDPRTELVEITGQKTVPQIFIGDAHIGGYDDLVAAHRSGRLAGLIS